MMKRSNGQQAAACHAAVLIVRHVRAPLCALTVAGGEGRLQCPLPARHPRRSA